MAKTTTNQEILVPDEVVMNQIYVIRGQKVMLDKDLAILYGVETKVLKQAVRRNIDRFPAPDFMFELTKYEFESLRSQIVTSKDGRGGTRYEPMAFLEAGVAMISSILNSERAILVNIQIIRIFTRLRQMINDQSTIYQRLVKIEQKQVENDEKFAQIFTALESTASLPEKGIFYDDQIFDAYTFVADLVRKAKTSIVLIDNYIDDTVLQLFTKRKKGVSLTIYTKTISKQLALDLLKHNSQYEPVIIKEISAAHDRFLIMDGNTLYHIGASLKDLGKKWFAFSKMDSEVLGMLNRLGEV